MRVLVVGGGGREHALCWAIAKSPQCDELLCAPGNAGIAKVAECVAVGADDIPGLVALAKDRAVDLVVVGPEGPLVAGLVDRLAEEVKHEGKIVQFMAPTVCMCSTMQRIDPQHLAWTLENLADGNIVNPIRVPPHEAELAKLALERMLAVS